MFPCLLFHHLFAIVIFFYKKTRYDFHKSEYKCTKLRKKFRNETVLQLPFLKRIKIDYIKKIHRIFKLDILILDNLVCIRIDCSKNMHFNIIGFVSITCVSLLKLLDYYL